MWHDTCFTVSTQTTQEDDAMRRLNPTIRKMLEGLAYADLAEMLPPSAKDRCLEP